MSAGPVQVILDCSHCRVEGAMVELVDAVATRGARLGQCRLCERTTVDGVETAPGRWFSSATEVESALSAWALAEGEPDVDVFLAANFRARSLPAVVDDVLARRRSETSFDVVAWLFRDRTGGQSVLGAGGDDVPAGETGSREASEGGPGAPGRGPGGAAPGVGDAKAQGETRPRATADPHAATVALVTVALSDGQVPAVERAAVLRECSGLGVPAPAEEDWRLWRPAEVGVPADPAATVSAMRRVALVTRLPDPSAGRVIREFARHWRVAVPEVILPPVTPAQRLSDAWMRFFGR